MSYSDTNMMPEFFANTEKLITTDDRQYYNKDDYNQEQDNYSDQNDLDDDVTQYKRHDAHGSKSSHNQEKFSAGDNDSNANTYNTYNSNINKDTKSNASDSDNRKDPDDERNWTKEQLALKKLDLIRKLGELKQYGVTLSQNYSMDSDYSTMKFEYDLHYSVRSKKNAVKLMCYLLFGVVKGAEMVNDRYNPFDMKFDGAWSKNVGSEISDYNEILGEIYEKWSPNGSKMAPEFRLLFALVGSAFTIQFFKGVSSFVSNNDTSTKSLSDADLVKSLRDKASQDKTMFNSKKMEEKYANEHNNVANMASNMQWLKESGDEYDKMKRRAEEKSQMERFNNNLIMSESVKSRSSFDPKSRPSKSTQAKNIPTRIPPPSSNPNPNPNPNPTPNPNPNPNPFDINNIFKQNQLNLQKQKLTDINNMLEQMGSGSGSGSGSDYKPPSNPKSNNSPQLKLMDSNDSRQSDDQESNASTTSRISVNPKLNKLYSNKANSTKSPTNINYDDISVGTKSKKSKDSKDNGSYGSANKDLKISVSYSGQEKKKKR